MRWPRFLLWNALGGAAWATSVALAAYVLGKAASAVLGGVGLALLVLVAVGGAAVLLLRRRRSSATTAARSQA
jgi:membrane protein DedA with SNARE-associated domain